MLPKTLTRDTLIPVAGIGTELGFSAVLVLDTDTSSICKYITIYGYI